MRGKGWGSLTFVFNRVTSSIFLSFLDGYSAMGSAKKATMIEAGRKIIVAIVKTAMVFPETCIVRALKTCACFCFRSMWSSS
jgi:hypothetical protein